MSIIISGIQQMGIGVPNVEEIWKWYRINFGINVKVFEDEAEAPLMTRYTGDVVQNRTATLALSLEGGGGFEIWQYKSRNTEKAQFDIQLGDLGLYACRIKSRDVEKSYEFHKNNGVKILGDLSTNPAGKKHYFVEDPNGNIFNVVDSRDWFVDTNYPSGTGGSGGCIIGVSDMEKSIAFYKDILEYDTVEYDETDVFEDLKGLPSGDQKLRRVLLSQSKERRGPFSRMLGRSKVELIQSLDRRTNTIFENRFWGDWGFIHLCYDIQGMSALKTKCEEKGYPFTVDSGDTFDMGDAGGRFSYVEDPDGAWIEFVETHKLPLLKKPRWSINLKKRNPEKPLPNWILKAMRFNRVK